MSYEELIDKRAYQKTIIIAGEIAVICRKNVDTKKMHTVKVDADAWLDYYTSDTQSTTFLFNAGLNDEEVQFIAENFILGETPQKDSKKPTKKSKK